MKPIKETYRLKAVGQGFVRIITSKRNIYIYNGGLPTHQRRGDLCVKKFGFEDGDDWLVEFVSGTDLHPVYGKDTGTEYTSSSSSLIFFDGTPFEKAKYCNDKWAIAHQKGEVEL